MSILLSLVELLGALKERKWGLIDLKLRVLFKWNNATVTYRVSLTHNINNFYVFNVFELKKIFLRIVFY